MILRELKLKDFRNYREVDFCPDPGINIICGNNAQGKTNLLEAVCLAASSVSHRGARDRDMIRFGCEEAHIKAYVENALHQDEIDIHLKKGKAKGIAVNHLPIRKVSDLIGSLTLVIFSPEDLEIIKKGPSERRRFIDAELCQLSRIYLDDLKKYGRVLEQRGKLLKSIPGKPDLKKTLDVWDEELVTYGKKIIRSRAEFIDRLGPIVQEIHRKLTGEKEVLKISYEPNVAADDLEERTFLNRDRDMLLMQTTGGPHRDDLLISSNGIDMRKFGSQGQQRTAALSMKLSEVRLVEEEKKEGPVLLLDDVLSELDRKRQEDLLTSIKGIQTIMTCTGLDDFVRNRFPLDHVFEVRNGTIGAGDPARLGLLK